MSNWTPPEHFRLSSESEVASLVSDERIAHVVRPLGFIANDLFEMNHPDQMDDALARKRYVDDVLEQGVQFGEWVHYPWNSTLVQFPSAEDHYGMRTFRNQRLITAEEQREKLRVNKIAAFGLSVGSNIIENTVISGIGDEYMLFDYDQLSPANLNRVKASMAQVGLFKTEVAGRKIAEVDPFITQQHFTSGYDRNTDEILRAERPTIIIEEVDEPEVKARLRVIASELAIPLVMVADVGDKSVLHVERHDLGSVKPFNGKLSEKEFQALLDGSASARTRDNVSMKTVGLRNLSPRLIQSAVRKGKELAGLPQLGTTAAAGGALAAAEIRDLFLNRNTASGIRVQDTRKILKSSAPTTWRENVAIVREFFAYRKTQATSEVGEVAELIDAPQSDAANTESDEQFKPYIVPSLDVFEIPRETARYKIIAATESESEALAIKAQQLQGAAYAEYGYISGDGLEQDGRIAEELDSTREKDGTNFKVTYLGASPDATIENAKATLRLIDAVEGSVLEDFPMFGYSSQGIAPDEKQKLNDFIAEHGQNSIREIAALATERGYALGAHELLRGVFQDALIKLHENGQREAYIASLTRVSLRAMHEFVGDEALHAIGENIDIESDDPRQNNVRLHPVFVDPTKILGGIVKALEEAKQSNDVREIQRNSARLAFFVDGLTDEQMGEGIAKYVRNPIDSIAISA